MRDVLHLEIGPHHVAWGDLVNRVSRLAVNAARDHGKTGFFSYAYPIWRAWSEPGCEVYLFSKTLEQAQEFLDHILYGKDEHLVGIVNIPGLANLIPSTEDIKKNPALRLNKSDVKFTNGSRIRVAGYGKAMRGRHPKYIVLDDPLNDEDMWSEMTRLKNIEYFKSAISQMVTREGQLIVVGTPFHASDLYGFLRKNEMYTFIRFPGIIKDARGNDRALFPWRWPLEALYDKRKEIGALSFSREILCQPISDDISIFPSHLFPPCFDDKLCMRMTRNAIKARGWVTYMGVDIARSSSVGADFFVIFVIARTPKGEHVIVDIRRSKGLPFQRQLDEIKIAAALYDPALIFIESNAMQQIYTSEMRRETDLPVKEFLTLATNKYPLDKGVPGLRILLEGQKIIIPRGDEISRKLSDIWIDECTQFGFIDGKLQGIGAHDDTCVLPGTLVTTKAGLVPIEDVREGDEVLTHKSRWRRVTGTTSRAHSGEIRTLQPVGSLGFSVTPEHPVWSASPTTSTRDRTNRLGAGEWAFAAASDVRAGRKMRGDWVSHPTPRWDGPPPRIDLADFVHNTERTLRCGGPKWKIDDIHVWWRGDRVAPRFIEPSDKDWGFLLGLYLAEGSVGGAAKTKHLVQFALHARETYIANYINTQSERLFAAPARTVKTSDNGMVCAFGSRPAAGVFRLLGKHSDKHLPWSWMSLPVDVRLGIVRGWLVGDGCVGNNAASNGSHLRGVSISRSLIEQMRITLVESGIPAMVRPFKNTSFRGSTPAPAWVLTIPAHWASDLLHDMNDVERERWGGFTSRENRGREPRRTLHVHADCVHHRVAANETRAYDGRVYNLHVEEDESYVVEGVAVHNCMAWWIATEAARSGGFTFSFGDGDKDDVDEAGEGEEGDKWEDVFLGDAEEDVEGAFG